MNEIQLHLRDSFQDAQAAFASSAEVLVGPIERGVEQLTHALRQEGKILICGNGGSASDALHFSAELLNRFERERPNLPAIALCADISTLTAIGNDYTFDEIFSRQIKALAKKEDVLVVLTTSGNSQNVYHAVEVAQEMGIRTIALTGRDGGKLGSLLRSTDIEIRVPVSKTSRIQEVHGMIIHCFCDLIDELLFPESKNKI